MSAQPRYRKPADWKCAKCGYGEHRVKHAARGVCKPCYAYCHAPAPKQRLADVDNPTCGPLDLNQPEYQI